MHRFRSTVCPYLPLPGTWEELLRGFRGELRQGAPVKIRRCERRGVRLVARESSGELDAAMDDLARLHQLRMEDTERGGNFRNPAYLAFHRDLMNAFAARGWLDLRFLELDGERIAVEYGFRYGRRFH